MYRPEFLLSTPVPKYSSPAAGANLRAVYHNGGFSILTTPHGKNINPFPGLQIDNPDFVLDNIRDIQQAAFLIGDGTE